MASGSLLLDDIFDKAVASFAASLTEKQRRDFRSCSRKDIELTILDIDSRLASERKQQKMRRIAKFVEGMTQLGKVIEVFVNCDATVAFIWGPIKVVLLVSPSGHRVSFVKLVESDASTYLNPCQPTKSRLRAPGSRR